MTRALIMALVGGVLIGVSAAIVVWASVGAPFSQDGCTAHLQMIPSLREGQPVEILTVSTCVRRLP